MARFNPTRFPPGFFDLSPDAGRDLPLDIIAAWTRSDQSVRAAAALLAPCTLRGIVVSSDAAGLTRLTQERSTDRDPGHGKPAQGAGARPRSSDRRNAARGLGGGQHPDVLSRRRIRRPGDGHVARTGRQGPVGLRGGDRAVRPPRRLLRAGQGDLRPRRGSSRVGGRGLHRSGRTVGDRGGGDGADRAGIQALTPRGPACRLW